MNTPELPAREAMEFDVVIVGAGPAGLAAAIRLKQLAPDTAVVVVEKGSEVGAHILSGAVIDPIGLDRLIPEWRNEDTPIKTAVTDDRFYALGPSGSLRLPNFLLPPLMSNHGTGQDVGADLGALLHYDDGFVGRQLLEPDRGGKAGRPRADNDGVEFHRLPGRKLRCSHGLLAPPDDKR